jgi:hypothetical protein
LTRSNHVNHIKEAFGNAVQSAFPKNLNFFFAKI